VTRKKLNAGWDWNPEPQKLKDSLQLLVLYNIDVLSRLVYVKSTAASMT